MVGRDDLASCAFLGGRVNSVAPRIVIFDLGEVLATPSALYESFAERIAHESQAVEASYWQHRGDYDRGGSSTAFWTAVLEGIGVPATRQSLEDLTQIDTIAWTTIRPDAFDLLRRLSDVGHRVGVLSNATIEMAGAARRTDWGRFVTDWFFSSELGIAKPDARIYRYVTERIALPASSIMFIDDRQVNVDAALAAGWNAHLWTSPDETMNLLAELGLIDAV
ncbi:putative hydrolase of the HAD superfamily [Glaciihabitans sp. GrIS 2.15]|nr:putative hydrolase of the HAD superfamily [Glaciihabitans sp. GrIS 2.15]